MNIVKYFDKNSKKRDLSGDSNPEKDRKKIRDGSSGSTRDSCDALEEGIESPLCKVILFSYLRNLQKKVTETFTLAQDTRNVQIKCRKQLEVSSDKFDEKKKDRKEKGKIINGLQNEVSSLLERIGLLGKKIWQ